MDWSGKEINVGGTLFPSLCLQSDFTNKSQFVTSTGHSKLAQE